MTAAPARRLALILGTGFADEVARLGGRHAPRSTTHGPVDPLFVVERPDGAPVHVLLRHGPGHATPPHRIDHRANLRALADVGATDVVSFASTGSLRADVRVGDLVTPDDLFDATFAPPTFFDHEVRHTSMHAPFDPALAAWVRARFAAIGGGTCHATGVYLGILGPRYPTTAELGFFATHGTIIGMTVHAEAALAAELGLRYANASLVTDGHDDVVLDHAKITAAAPATRAHLTTLCADLLATFGATFGAP